MSTHHRDTIARIPLNDGSEIVVSVDTDGAADLRRWTRTGDLKFPSGKGVLIPSYAVRAVIDALKQVRRAAA